VRQVMIACPVTNQLTPAGIETASIEKLDQPQYLLIDCLECGQDHPWEPHDAVLSGPVLAASQSR